MTIDPAFATLRLGRISGLAVEKWGRTHGGGLTFSGTFRTRVRADAEEVDIRRAQFEGLGGRDEPYIPVAWSTDPSVNGFYSVVSATCDPLGTVRNGQGRWSVGLKKIACSSFPMAETNALTVVRPSEYGSSWEPAFFRHFGDPGLQLQSNPVAGSRRAADGSDMPNLADNLPLRRRASVDTFYVGAATILARGGSWWPLIDRQMPANVAPTRLLLTNGLIRIGVGPSGTLVCAAWDGVRWDDQGDFTLGYRDATAEEVIDLVQWSSPVIARNDIDQVVVEMYARPTDDTDYRICGTAVVTIALAAGDHHAEITVSPPPDTLAIGDGQIQWRFSTATPCTPSGPSLYPDDEDAGGNRWFLITPHDYTAGNTLGKVTFDAAPRAHRTIAIAVELDGDSADVWDTRDAVVDAFFKPVLAKTTVTGR